MCAMLNGNINCILKMRSILFVVFCCAFYGVTTQASEAISTLAIVSPSQFSSSHQAFIEETKSKKDKFSCVLNLLKTALSEELENSHSQITEETTQESVLSSINSILEEEQKKKGNEEELQHGVQNDTSPDAEKALYQKIISKIALAFAKPQNDTNNQNNTEMPSMIPIFKPRKVLPKSELNQNIADFKPAPISRQILKSRAVSFVPEKIIQTNMSPIPSQAMFSIPCQRAADILDMTNIAIPKEATHRNVNVKPSVSPIVEAPKPNLPSPIPAPITLSVNNADSDDAVAMLFRPKKISLMQLYGNLLKKITITVLVPYHMSKLGGQ